MYHQSAPSRFLASEEPKKSHGDFDFEGSRVEMLTELGANGPKNVTKPSGDPKPFYVFYYWSMCPHCHDFAPEYKKMSEDDKEDYYAIESDHIPGVLDIHSFPTVILYDKDGKEQKRALGCHKKEKEEEIFSDTLKRLENMVVETKSMVEKHVMSNDDYIKILRMMVIEITPENVEWLYGRKWIPSGVIVCVYHKGKGCYLSPLKVIDCPHGEPTCKNFDELVHCQDISGKMYDFSCKNGDIFYYIG